MSVRITRILTGENPIPRCGDTVVHEPSGETWTVAWAEGDDIAPCGWPNTLARISDCRVVDRATDDQHREMVQLWLDDGTDSRAIRVKRLYGSAVA